MDEWMNGRTDRRMNGWTGLCVCYFRQTRPTRTLSSIRHPGCELTVYAPPPPPSSKVDMVKLTRKLIRKKAEHHEDILPELEEISLHQLEIEKIEAIGDICRKIKILYLQNNIISKIENLQHCKDMEYLNLALNNIERIENLRTMEFLKKLDLTVNFIGLDTLEDSIAELRYNRSLKELYLMGNPCTDWEGCKSFVIAVLPNLKEYDGKEITRSERIVANQQLPNTVKELRKLARAAAIEKREKAGLPYDEEEYTPQSRLEMYREMAEEKQADEDRKKEMEPKERDYQGEHYSSVQEQRAKEREKGTNIRQCNEGKYEFRMTEEDGNGNVILEIDIPKFIDTSLVDVDVQPTYASVIIKNKTTRLTFPEEIKPDEGEAQRSQVNGTLKLTLPKVDPTKALKSYKFVELERQRRDHEAKELKEGQEKKRQQKKVGYAMLEAAGTATTLDFRNIVRKENEAPKDTKDTVQRKNAAEIAALESQDFIDDADVPPLE